MAVVAEVSLGAGRRFAELPARRLVDIARSSNVVFRFSSTEKHRRFLLLLLGAKKEFLVSLLKLAIDRIHKAVEHRERCTAEPHFCTTFG